MVGYEGEQTPRRRSYASSRAFRMGDRPLWCRSGQKIRVPGIQTPNLTNAEPCRRPDACRADYTCYDHVTARSQPSNLKNLSTRLYERRPTT